jgi:hypothetical protein
VYKYTAEKTGKIALSVGFKAFDTNHTLKGEVSQSASVELALTLAGGHLYRLYRTTTTPGIVWELD